MCVKKRRCRRNECDIGVVEVYTQLILDSYAHALFLLLL
jgi:hypothetical protein